MSDELSPEELSQIREETRRREEEERRAPLPTEEELAAIRAEREREARERTAPETLRIQEQIAAWHRLNKIRLDAEAAAQAQSAMGEAVKEEGA